MLCCDALSLSFDGRPVIKCLTHRFPERGIVAIMGASGAGKTSLLRLFAGLEMPTAGKLTNTYQKVAFAFQEPRLVPWLTAMQNVTLITGEGAQGAANADRLLALLELTDARSLFPNELSGGMQKRVSLARALGNGADLVLLDEPFAGLDADCIRRIAPVVRNANPNGLTILVTHDEEEAALLGATILAIDTTPIGALLPR